MEEIEEKDRKMEEYKRRCDMVNQQKAQAAADGQRKREEMIAKFDKIIKQNKEIEAETVKELFPDDEELYQKIKEMKEKQKQEENKNNDKKSTKKDIQDDDNQEKTNEEKKEEKF